jgi:hypothetical protein
MEDIKELLFDSKVFEESTDNNEEEKESDKDRV